MMVRRFARPYARAIMDAAGSPQVANEIRADLARFDEVLRGSAELSEVLANPGIELEAKLSIARQVASRLKAAPMAVKVLEVVLRNHRMRNLDSIVAAVATYVNQATNTVVADVRAAHALSEAELNELRSTLERKFQRTVEMEVTTDPTLLGGFIARVGSEIYDASVAGKIDKFRDSLTQGI